MGMRELEIVAWNQVPHFLFAIGFRRVSSIMKLLWWNYLKRFDSNNWTETLPVSSFYQSLEES